MRNRKLEFCTSGSVRGEDGNILTYPAVPQAVEILIWRETNGKHLGEHVTNDSSDAAVAIDHRCSRGAAIDNKPIVALVHFQERCARKPLAGTELNEPPSDEMRETFRVDKRHDLVFRHQRLPADLEGAND